ncbi:TetR/AcrR family transcriptional regulator [Listeria innocua]|nr:TetR/AcrR family transcriptional regulator [Listeria innocua]
MANMAFSETERKNIKERLLLNCEESWALVGYKKTNVDELCKKAGISKGSFYLFYQSKEELFCDVMIQAQKRLVRLTEETLGSNPTKKDLTKALQLVYREYVKIPFLTETESPDFIAFINRLSPDNFQELENHGNYDIQEIIKQSGLTYRIEEEKGLASLALLLTSLRDTRSLPWEYLEVFDFILETVNDTIFE